MSWLSLDYGNWKKTLVTDMLANQLHPQTSEVAVTKWASVAITNIKIRIVIDNKVSN